LFEFPHVPAASTSKAKLQMTNYTNKTLLRDRKRWRIKRWWIRQVLLYYCQHTL